MVDLFVTSCDTSQEFAVRALTCITTEYEYWTTGNKSCIIVDCEGTAHYLSRYYANWSSPRPESFRYVPCHVLNT